MRTSPALVSISALFISLAACGTSTSPAPQASVFPVPSQPTEGSGILPPSTSVPSAETATLQARTSPAFRVAVIVDTISEPVTRGQAQALIEEAGTFLQEFSPIKLEMIDFVEDGRGGSTADMAGRYISTRSAALPDGIVIFSFGDQGQAKTSGGYGYSLAVQGGFKNPFISPSGSDSQMYVGVVHFGHKYMACGYGNSDAVQSPASLPGECGGQAGMACVSKNGYSMCASAVGNLYTSTPTHFASSMIIHSLLHNFGPGGDQDHYATPECNARMGYPAAFFDLQESQYYNGLCPFVYEDFTKSYRP